MKNKPSKILMVRPVSFGYNRQTAATNSFQKNDKTLTADEIQKAALKEFNKFVKLLKANSIQTKVVQDKPTPATPDSIFPNNLMSFHTLETFSGPAPPEMELPNDIITFKDVKVLIIYSMLAKNRRLERKWRITKRIAEFTIVFDLSANEKENNFLEGTGSIVFDYENHIAYANDSPRTSLDLFKMLCKQLEYTPVTFSSTDTKQNQIYHTNVMLCIGKGFAVVCYESIKDKEELFTVMKSLIDTDHEIISIDYKQLNAFAGNMYQLFNEQGESFIVMSEQAYLSLHKAQINKLEKHGTLLYTPLYTIEKYGGGSARCMITDIRF